MFPSEGLCVVRTWCVHGPTEGSLAANSSEEETLASERSVLAASLTRGSCPLRSCPGLSSLPRSLNPLWLAFVINVERLKSLTWVKARQRYWSCVLLSWTGHERDDGSQRAREAASLAAHRKGVLSASSRVRD